MADVSTEVTQRELFGGAMRISLPPRLVDISDVRPVPDHQEVFADVDTDSSLIVEVLEIHPTENVGRYYFRDMAEANGAEGGGTVEEEGVLDAADVAPTRCAPAALAPTACAYRAPVSANFELYSVRGLQEVAKFREAVTNSVLLLMAVIRLPNQTADVLVTVNQPIAISEASSSHKSAGSVEEEVRTARHRCTQPPRRAPSPTGGERMPCGLITPRPGRRLRYGKLKPCSAGP